VDFFATLAELAGAPLPADTTLDSISLVETILNGKTTKRNTFAYYRGPNLEAVRRGDWKLHFCKGDQVLSELYNLRDDIAETDNVYDRHPKLVAEIEAVAEEFRRVFGDRRLNCVGTDIREVGLCNNPKPLT
jgi:arylsulfatase A